MYDKRAVSGAAEHVFADTTETRFQIQLRKKKIGHFFTRHTSHVTCLLT